MSGCQVGWAVVDEDDCEMNTGLLYAEAVEVREDLEAFYPDVLFSIVPADRLLR